MSEIKKGDKVHIDMELWDDREVIVEDVKTNDYGTYVYYTFEGRQCSASITRCVLI